MGHSTKYKKRISHAKRDKPEPVTSVVPQIPLVTPLPAPVQSPLASLFTRPPAQLTRENIVKDLVSPQNYEFKTDIRNPFSVAAYDTFALWFSRDDTRIKELLAQYEIFAPIPGKLTVDVLLRYYGARMRINAISHARLSRAELVEALKQVQFQEDKDKGKKLLEGLFGEAK